MSIFSSITKLNEKLKGESGCEGSLTLLNFFCIEKLDIPKYKHAMPYSIFY